MLNPSHLKVILFADICGSSSLYKTLGDEAAKAAIDDALNAMVNTCEEHGGSLVKTLGDEVMVAFDDPSNAAICSQRLQQHCRLLNRQQPLHIGMSYGEALLEDGDWFGEVVNNAAFLTQQAKAGQILLDKLLASSLEANLSKQCQEFDQLTFKGQQQPQVVYRLLWESKAQIQHTTRILPSAKNEGQSGTLHLTLSYGDQSVAILPQQTPFVLGRDKNKANLAIKHPLASRLHCELVFRRGKFVLIDNSTNGTYVTPNNQAEIYLRREALPLIGEGTISFGQPSNSSGETSRYTSDVVHFSNVNLTSEH